MMLRNITQTVGVCVAVSFLVQGTAFGQTRLDLQSEWQWKDFGVAAGPRSAGGIEWHALKDPSVVHHEGKWYVFCTVRGNERSHGIVQFSFGNWNDAALVDHHLLINPAGYFCAPQVFYFTPHKKWYLICQASDPAWGDKPFRPAFATSENIDDPNSWSPLSPMYRERPTSITGWIDFWVICDEQRAHLFFTSNDGRMWRAETAIADFPLGWNEPQLALQDDIFEASHTYTITGDPARYVTIVEAQNGHPWRYYKAYIADKLEGPWEALSASKEKPFAAPANTEFGKIWTDSVSHGELLRKDSTELMPIELDRLQMVYQGVLERDRVGKKYGEIPWKLGLLELKSP